MKVKSILVALFFLAMVAFGGFVRSGSIVQSQSKLAEQKQLKFAVKAIEQKGESEQILSESTIEGPPGTDFNIDLQDKRFKIDARFMTDMVASDSLGVRATLNTHRLYGYSDRQLPLYEEDTQDKALQVNLGDKMVLLPFGERGGDNLRIEIVPSIGEETAYLPSGAIRSIEIKILKAGPGGALNIQADRIPHRFSVEMSLLEDGNEIAHASAGYLLRQPKEVVLKPVGADSSLQANSPLAVNFMIDQYQRNRPIDQVNIQFDVHRIMGPDNDKREVVALDWAGTGNLGSSMNYNLDDYIKSSGKKYELKFIVRLAAGESAD